MPAVIQKLVTPEGMDMPTVMSAVRVDDLFHGEEWKWDADRDNAFVFATFEQADAKARELGAGAYPVVRVVTPRKPVEVTAPTPEPARAAAVRGVSPSQMAAGDTKARIAAAKQNKRVTAQRRSAEDFRKVYEATCERMREHDDE